MDYRQSGVDIDAGNETVRRIRSLARSTFTPGVLSDIGSFGGLFRLDRQAYDETYEHPDPKAPGRGAHRPEGQTNPDRVEQDQLSAGRSPQRRDGDAEADERDRRRPHDPTRGCGSPRHVRSR